MSAHRLTQIGFVLALLGGVAIAYGGAMMAYSNRNYGGPTGVQHRREKMAYALGGLLLALGFLLELIATATR
jgi:hypothetical protein